VTDSLPPEDPRDALIREQAQRIAAQAERIAVLEAVVADLRERLEAEERAGPRNGRKRRSGCGGSSRVARAHSDSHGINHQGQVRADYQDRVHLP
jgi:hypothetical protein